MSSQAAGNLPAILATEAEAARRLRLGLGFGKMGCLFGSAFAVFFLLIGHYWGALVVVVCTAGFAANLLVLRRGHLALAGNIYALLLTSGFALLTAIEGGLAGHAIAWLAVMPLCTCLFAGPRAGERWSLACLGIVGVFGLFSCLGYRVPVLYPEQWTNIVSALGYLALTVFMTKLGVIFETSRRRAFQELRLTLDELADKNRALFHSMDELSRSEARFRMLFENSALGVALLNGNGDVEIGNARLAALLGLPAAKDFNLTGLFSSGGTRPFPSKNWGVSNASSSPRRSVTGWKLPLRSTPPSPDTATIPAARSTPWNCRAVVTGCSGFSSTASTAAAASCAPCSTTSPASAR